MNPTDTPRIRLFDSRKKKIIIFSAMAVAFLGLAFAVYAILVTPQKQPYRDAHAQYKNVYNANVTLIARGGSLNAKNATDETFNKNTNAMKSLLDALKLENDQLGKKEVLQGGEGKALYTKFTAKLDTYIAFYRDMITSMQKVRPVVYGCSVQMTGASEDETGVRAMRECSNQFAALQAVPNADYQSLVKSSQVLYSDFATNLEKRAALVDPKDADKAQYDQYSEEQESIFTALNQVSDVFAKDLNTHKQEVDITKEAMALEAYLEKKGSVF